MSDQPQYGERVSLPLIKEPVAFSDLPEEDRAKIIDLATKRQAHDLRVSAIGTVFWITVGLSGLLVGVLWAIHGIFG